MNKLSKILISSISVIGIIGAAAGVHFGYAKTTDDLRTYDVDTNGGPLRVAIISDLQLHDAADDTTHQYQSFEQTLTMLKNKGMDALIIGGDFTDISTKSAWAAYKEIYDKVMGSDEKPIPIYIMGNHDYWLKEFFSGFEIPTPAKLQKRFTAYTGEYPYSHKVINGYHFICWSSSNGSYDKSYTNKDWIKAELDLAVADAPDKPIFVISHLNPFDTVYGSDEWGNADITDVLKDYSQVISISGHSHFSLLDERSIWQGDFTAFSTQSLDYIELEEGKFNGTIPKDAYGNVIGNVLPACLYMEIDEDKVTINRLEANTGNVLKEPWVIDAPFGSEDSLRKYTNQRKDNNKPPKLDSDLKVSLSKITDVNDNEQTMIAFKSGTDDDFVHSYRLDFLDDNQNPVEFDEMDYDNHIVHYDKNGDKISFDNKKYDMGASKKISSLLYFSDYVLGLGNMSETTQLSLPSNLPSNVKYVVITAIDSWGAESNSVVCEL